MASRVYDLVVVGATGYTGTLTAEHIAQFLPTNTKWAIAGRSTGKIEELAARLNKLSPDRVQPVVEIVNISDETTLAQLVGRAKVCISVVSYWQVGEKVVKACIESGTDYVDANLWLGHGISLCPETNDIALDGSNGDIYGLKGWINKYHEQAVAKGVTKQAQDGVYFTLTSHQLIHACAVFTAPHDLLTLLLVRELQSRASVQARKVVVAVAGMPMKISGGTAESIMHGATYSSQDAAAALQNPWLLSPVPGDTTGPDDQTDAFGMHSESGLGLLSDTSYSAAQDRHIVHRTWGLLSGSGNSYGSRFRYREYNRVESRTSGILKYLIKLLTSCILRFAFLRAFAKRFVFPAPGEGPDVEQSRLDHYIIEAVAVGEPDGSVKDKAAPRAYGRFTFHGGGGYLCTAACLAQGAAALVSGSRDGVASGHQGGMLTPAFLGAGLVERLCKAGGEVEVRMM
ncbi:hypothetical protein PG993_009386 [Apiospora rasikravindrae]|uniref:Saccharopine dehydrogenase NADP binding domain-containing protein n=1 Tax=Apiospora rasikravindrae TaxID=990691 RepID=A0ABR1SJ87_9PEZI